MNIFNYKIAALLLCLCPVILTAADYIERVSSGNKAYSEKDFKTAMEHYTAAEAEIPNTPELEYNLAGTLYQQGKFEEAVERYTKALNTTDLNSEAAAHYNLGNTYFKMGDYQNAIKSYQSSLEINPDDMDAKFNLELSRKMLKEQMKPDDQQQQEQDKKEQQEQEKQDQQDQNQEEQDKQDSQNQQQQDDQQQQEQDEKSQAQPQDEKEMSREDAERILNALKDDERETQKKVKRNIRGGNYSGKDW